MAEVVDLMEARRERAEGLPGAPEDSRVTRATLRHLATVELYVDEEGDITAHAAFLGEPDALRTVAEAMVRGASALFKAADMHERTPDGPANA